MKKVDLWDLTDEKIYVKVEKSHIKAFFEYAVKFAGSESKLAKLLGMKRVYNVWVYKNGLYFVPLRFIMQILNVLPKNKRNEFMKKIEENLEEIKFGYGLAKPIKKPKLPIRVSPVLAKVAGHLTGDGGIRMVKGDYSVHYTNKCDFLIEQFKKDMIRIFGDIKAYHYCYRNRNRGLMVVGFPSITGIILMKILGPMAGDLKHVPNVIVNSDKKSKALYLRALFDDEGCVSSKRVCIVMSNKNVMETVKDMLKEFSIETGEIAKRCFGDKWKTSFRVEIFGEHDIKLFAKEINFSHPDKKKKLRTFLEEYVHKKPKYKKGETSKLILEILKKNEMGVNEIAKQLNRKPGHRLREQLHKLGKEGKIKSRKERNLNIYYIDSKSRKV